MKRIICLLTAVICATSYGYRDLETGTFLTRDPAGFKDGPNQYCYVRCNPVNKIDPHGLWGVLPGFGGRAHQYITKRAIKQSGVKMNFFKRRSRIFGAGVRADVRPSHRKPENNYRHSTSIGESAKETKDKMMAQAKEWYKEGGSGGLGKLYHMVQDSYCPGHTERDENGNIVKFHNYEEQKKEKDGAKKHRQMDKIKDQDGDVRPEVQDAIDATADLMKLTENGAEWEEVEKHLNENVFVLQEEQQQDTQSDTQTDQGTSDENS